MAQVVVVFMTLHLHNRSIKMTPGVCFHHLKRHRLNTKSLTQKQPVTIATLRSEEEREKNTGLV